MKCLYFVTIFGLFRLAGSQCTWPSELVSSTWVDNFHGDLMFNTTIMSGWSFSITTGGSGQFINEWQCVISDQFDTDGFLVMRSVNDFTLFVTSQYYAYVCLKMKKITDFSYRYYIFEPEQPNINNERYLVSQNGALSSTSSTCYESYGASGSEYRVIVKSGNEAEARVTCPWVFLGRFDYFHTENGVNTCTSGNNNLDVCTDKEIVAFDFTQCSTDVAYSGQTSVLCIDNVPVGTDTFMTLYTSTAVDGINTFTFSCLGISSDLTTVSVAPEYCRKSQTTSSAPTDGALVTLTSIYELCRTCAVLSDPDGGNVTVQTDGADTVAYYTCASQYDMYGDPTRTCQSNETWTGSAPVCKCKFPSVPTNGNVTVSSDGLLATYTCHPGYVLTGNQYRTCQANGNAWNGTDPTCDTCATLINITNGLTSLSYEGVTSIASFSCYVNYTLSGPRSVVCQSDGTWNDTVPTCVTCDAIVTPNLGSVTMTTNGIQTTASYSCDTGYEISGVDSVTCQTDGSWNGTVPSCICETPVAPTSGSVNISTDGMTATYSCYLGYSISGVPTRECLLNGSSWTNSSPTCELCSNLTTLSGGTISYTSDGLATIASYSCLLGYTLYGPQTTTCSSNGIWSSTVSTCVTCPTLINPSAGNVSVSTNGTVSIATYSCLTGYDLHGDNTRTCQVNGTWTNTASSCSCLTPSTPTNGNINITGDTVQYTCDVGYSLDGDNVRYCLYDGTGWNGTEPSCSLCDNLTQPPGGNYTIYSIGGMYTYATFTCTSGYTMDGASSLTCLSDGSWNASQPNCTQCSTLSNPVNGSVSFSTNGQVTMAMFTCDLGTSVSDTSAVTSQCNTDGTWTSTGATCVSCDQLTEPNSGNITVFTNGTITTALYSCSHGYYLLGDSSRSCLGNGSWTGTDSTCVCDTPSTVTNGQVTISVDGMLAIYTCDLGYSMNGGANLTCQTDGTGWDSTPPTCSKCTDLAGPLNGNVTVSTNGTSSLATYLCDVGYTMSGTSQSTCDSSGNWTTIPPSCVQCDSLSSPAAGSITLSYNGTNTQASFTCDINYYIQSGYSSILTCQADGTWDGSEPTCVCEVPGAPNNGNVTVAVDGLTANYTCDVNYSLNGTDSRVCNIDGSFWSDQQPVCVSCSPLPSIQRGSISYTTNGQTTTAQYTCDVGSTLSGVNTRFCRTDGAWNDTDPYCAECPALSSLPSGVTSLTSDGHTTIAVFNCTTGYYLAGDTSIQCLTTGQWSNTIPSCLCNPPTAPFNGSVSLSNNNQTATYTCELGYILSGSSIRTCGLDGSGWSGTQPECVTCEVISAPTNGTVNVTSDGIVTQAVFTCLAGSTLVGNYVLTCTLNGTWDDAPPTCATCQSLSAPSSGGVSVSTNGTESIAEFTCDTGYSVVGNSLISCQTDSSWTGSVPDCVCDPPSVPMNGSTVLSTDGMTVVYSCDVGTTLSGPGIRYCLTDGRGWTDTDPLCADCPDITPPSQSSYSLTTNGSVTMATFNCSSGYTLSGSVVTICQSNGFWDTISPVCVQCTGLSAPDSGSVNEDSDGISSTAQFTCVSGYQVYGSDLLTCLNNGSWNSNPPSCVCIPPSSPTNGNITISTDLMTATYTCNAGYTLQGQITRTCQTGGAGWTDSQPSCNQCAALSNPLGGSITMTTTGAVTQATFTCTTGYTVSGGATLTCRDDGTWDISAPSCSSCNTLSSPNNGLVALSTDGSTTVANVTCSAGYTVSGSSSLTCKADGSWDFTLPSCATCAALSTVSAGTVSLQTNGVTTTAVTSCVPGYYISGEATITCLSDGTWDNNLPSCVCDSPSSPVNGSLVLSNNGMTVTYTCDVGYTLVGDDISLCDGNGSAWSSQTPSCVYCKELDSSNNVTTSSVSNGTTTIVAYTCGVGSTLSGTPTLACLESGNWTSQEPTCVECPSISAPINGTLSLDTNGTTTTAIFTCDVGYTLSGSDSLFCQSDGTWSHLQPTCSECDTLATVNSGNVTLTTDGLVTMATFTCVTEYYIDGSSKLTCQSDGTWDVNQPTCVCNPPPSLLNGDVWLSSDGMMAVYSCNQGYSLLGETSNTCNVDGTGWQNGHPSCTECQPLIPPTNGNITQYTNGSFTSAQFSCSDGYTLSSDVDISVCMDDGLWNLSTVACVACESLPVLSSGSVSIESQGSYSIAKYSCTAGYDLQGVTQRSCSSNGIWDLSPPICVCQSPSFPSNGNLVISVDQQTVTYTCDVGYSLNGVASRQCASDGTGWTNTDPQCVPCSTLTAISGGDVILITDGLTTTANYSCDPGYSMSGNKLLTCRSDGTWDFSSPSCVSCDPLTTSSFGTETISTDGTTSSVIFTCNHGYTLTGSPQATCSSTGSWSNTEPDCVECANLTDPNSGTFNTTTNGTHFTAVFTCSSGYSLIGQDTLTCQSDGSWDGLQPTCVCDLPNAPIDGNVTLSDNGYTATFSCLSRYTLSGDSVLTCSQSGAGWNGSTPVCVECSSLSPPVNGTLTTYTDGITTVVVVGCDVGYTASGLGNLTCQIDGSYDVVTPSCVKCTDLQPLTNGDQEFSSLGSETIVTFTCDLGYSLSGQSTSTCLNDGSWTESVPTCVQCATFPTITSSTHVLNTNGTVASSTVTCASGYSLTGVSTVTCGNDGTWSSPPSCLCDSPGYPINGNVTANGHTAVFTCDLGYSLNGSQISYCSTDGTGWNTSIPVCVLCSPTTTPNVGQADSFSDGVYTYILYTCPVGYTLSGNQTITCEDAGTWSSVEPTCASCAALTTPDSSNITMTTDNSTTSVLYTCSHGYYLDGVDTRLCLDDGTWTDTEPVCYCTAPNDPLNGNVEVTTNKTSAVYTCDVGYTLSGVSSRVCQVDSAGWSGVQPTCTLCSSLSTPTGGFISTSTDGTVTMATFTCGSGYTLVGSQSVVCRSDGSWNTSTPNCVTCDPLTYPTGGSYSITTDGLTSVIEYTCGSGYTLSGSNNIACSTTGQWIGQAPSCVLCASLTTPDSGTVDLISENFTTKAIFSCNHGYYLSHMSNLTCDSTGQWDNTEPKCLCHAPSNITNGNYILSTNQSEVIYSCDTGYTLNGSVSRACQSGGLGWTGNDPICVQCAPLATPSGGSLVTSSNGSTTVTTVSCDTGSTLSGNFILECETDGAWSVTLPTCVQCPSPTVPANGNYTMSSNGTQTEVEFVCNAGYTMDGISIADCDITASWSSVTPTCVLCSSLHNISNGDMNISANGTVTFATFSCVSGYYLMGDNLLECRIDGSWNDISPSCVCDPPLSVVNGNYTISSDSLTVEYTCDLGYTMSGSSSRSCGQDGTGWSRSSPTCTSCDSLSTITNGDIVLVSNGTYTTALFECDAGYSVDAAEYAATCNTDGTWNISSPACVQCPTLASILNGNVTLTSSGPESVITYSCLLDYTLVGDQVRICQQGTWNGSDPECLCFYTNYLQNGNVMSDGKTISYTCNTGYTLNGPSNRTCQSDGTGWSLTEPNCVLCDGLTTPSAGNMNLSSDSLVTTAYFTCLIGYTLAGSFQLTCRTDGTWNTVEPSCGVACSSLSLPQGGSVTIATDGFVTTAIYSCDTGYSLFGAESLTCRSDGTWDLTESICVQCQTVSAPSNGYLTTSNNETFSLATYTCDPDYYLEGANISTCQTDGSWNNPPPICYCKPPTAPANGSISVSTDRSNATFTCTEGFTLQGNSTLTCQNDYSGWSDTTPSCVYCGAITSVQNGTTTITTDGTVTSVVHTCITGTTLSGSSNISCSSNGTWEDVFPTCVTCDDLQTLENGTTILATDGLQTFAQFSCDLGYSLNGEELMYCSSDGSWNTSVPECLKCDDISTPSSGSKLELTDGITSQVTFSCVPGYHIEGDSNLICLTDGTWNGSSPTCVCDLPTPPTNGQMSAGSNTSVVHYTCDTGFTLDGDSHRVCSEQGTGWIGADPLCVQCDGLFLTSNLSSTLSTNGTTSVAMFECDIGFSMDGPDQLECLINGSWSGNLPTCEQCADLNVPDSGNISITTDGLVSTALFTCNNGYIIHGYSTLNCNSTGLWNGLEPLCICESPSSPINGDVASDGLTALYTCNVGYSLYGDTTRVCQQGGQSWNGSQPACTACSSLDSVSGGSVVMTTDGTTTVVEYTCSAGYTMFGASTLSCRSDGTWDFANTTCVTCDTLMVPDNGNLNITSNGEISTASHTCDTGYTLKGTSVLTCRTDGTWDFAAPDCVKCSDLTNPSSGSVSISSDGEVSSAVYTCVPRYYLTGDDTRVCGTDGTWNGTEPSCVCNPPVTPSNSNITYTDGNMTAQYTCDVGYTLSGSATLACQTNGNGWNSSSPTCNKCDNFTEVSNSSIQFITEGDRTVGIVTCHTGTTLVGLSEVECQADGTWNIVSSIQCVSCRALVDPTGGNVFVSSNGSVTIAEFTCDTNYSLSGNHHLQCLNTGLWDGNTPVCVQCATVDTPLSGFIDLSSDGYSTIATYSCNSGYEVFGYRVLVCLDDGTWNSTQPVCVCEAPFTPTNGNIGLSADRLQVTFTCDVGYSLNGEGISICDLNGSGWNATVPTCVVCSSLSVISNGNVTLLTNQTSTYAMYTCEVGYTLNGDVTRTCLDDGTWTAVEPSCVQCLALSNPLSGLVTITTDGHYSTAVYVCAAEYQLDVASTRTCQTDGQWNGTEPTCSCLLPSPPTNGDVIFGSNVSLAVYTCNNGYSLDGTPERVCQTDGTGWDNITPNCVICETLSSIPGATAVLTTDGLQTTAFYTCNTGYTLVGQANLMCRSDGTWNVLQPSCVTCEALTIPDGGAVTLNSNNSVTAALFTCASGYSLQGSSVLTCRSTGTWDFTEPNCVSCPTLISPSSGNVNVSTNGQVSSAVYTCVSGYYLDGDDTLTCLTTGLWDGSSPYCKCNPPSVVANGNFSILDNGTVLTHTCNTGYSMSGSANQICDSNGTGWLGKSPNCSRCVDLQNFTSGVVSLTTDGEVTIATYSCNLGYSIGGSSVLTCLADGTWDFTEPNCEICANVTSPANGSVQYSSDGSTTYIQYTCDTGYSLNGDMLSYCLSDGTWNYSQPSCVACPSVDIPDNGQVAVSSNGTITIATVTCNLGYSVVGEVTITCLSTGQWSHTTPYCLCDDFIDPINGNLVTTNNGAIAVYTCVAGYTLNGDETVECGTTSANYTPPTCTTCESLLSSAGLTANITTDGTTTGAIVSCNTGYTIAGDNTLTCRSDGTWDISLPECVSCDPLSQPDFSTISMTSLNSVTVATITCDNGTSLSGATILTCRADGTWDYVVPTCVQCPVPTPPSAGNVTMTTDGLVSMVTYNCADGYYTNDSTTSVCLIQGNWSSDTPICVCNPPPHPDNGSYSLTDEGFTAVYSCNSGYSLLGSMTLTCDIHGNGWNDSSPTCTKCVDLQNFTSGVVSLTTDGEVTIATYSCNLGYSIGGSSVLTCLADGTWDFTEPDCEICANVTSPANGSVQYSSDGSTTYIQYTCDTGYSLNGDMLSYCLPDGTWNYSQPSCVACPSIDIPDNGQVAVSSNGTITIATVTCYPGYSVVGEVTITCLSTGQWSQTTPYCLCDDFIDPINGNLVTTNNGTVAVYTCEAGYTLNGDATVECGTTSANYTPPTCTTCESLPSSAGLTANITTDGTTTGAIVSCNTGYTIAGDNTLTCRSDGTWDISLPECVSCDPLSQPDFSTISMNSLNSVTVATITCDNGTSLSGATTLTCRADGTWDYVVPTCVQCPIPTPPSAGNVTMTTDGLVYMVTYNCADGYYTNDSTTSVCLTQGNWSSDTPICVCNPPPHPVNGSYSLTDELFTAVYSCNSGYSLLGSMTLTCDIHGNGWNDSSPTCTKCLDISPSTNSSIAFISDGTTTYAEFNCDTGYTISGSASLICDENGSWSGSVPSCEQCPVLISPNNGSFTLQSNGTVTSVVYQCGEGSSLLGSSESMCCSNGTWTSTQPNCVSCPNLEPPHNGAIQLSTNGSVTMTTFSCLSGYSVLGESVITCLTSGQWSHISPTCFCDDFTQLVNGNINLLDNGTKASYSCDAGYSLNGDSEITCGSASSTYTTPTCSSCDSLTLPAGSSVTMTTDNTTTFATFECDTGYTILGDSMLTCRSDGTWDISTPTCASCQTLSYPLGANINITSVDSITVAHISCLVGYTMTGTNTLTCRSDGSWDFELPTCVQCEMLSSPSAGNVTMTTDGLVSSALFSCTGGYYLDGVSMVTCNITGQWSNAAPICKCESPSNLANGSYILSDGGFTVTYSCNVGYTMTGSNIRTCDTGGYGWSGAEPVCVACEEIVTDSTVTLSLNGTTSTAGFTCEAGYNIVGSFSLVCNEDGTWSGNIPTCQQCTALSAPNNGSITIQSNGTVSSVSFTCAVGSTLYGESQAVCNDTGVWSFEEPLCVPCSILSSPLNGAFTMTTDGTVTIATFLCDSGYILTGDETLTCSSNGSWDSSPPVCNCEIFQGLLNGNMNISDDGTKAFYTCSSGYTLNGVTELDCTLDNTSTIIQPSCVTCVTLPTIPGASVAMTTDGIITVADVTCNVGYSLSGDNMLACRSDGTWNVTIPTCVVCDSLSASSGVNVTLSSDGEVTRAIFTCPYGFTLNGSSQLDCRTDGSWNLNTPSCECDPPASILNGDLTLSSDRMTATYTCHVGYSLSGLSTRTCSTDGSWWTGIDPYCTECVAIPMSQGLNVTLHTDGSTTTAVYQCDSGYTISHRRNLTCLQNGTWDDFEPDCVPCPLLNVSAGQSYELTSDGWTTAVLFICSDGYSMTGPMSVKCMENGTWEAALPSCDVNVVSATSDCENQNNGAAIGLGVLFAIAAILAIIFAVIAWRYRKLYKGLGGSKASFYSAETQNWILQDTDRFTPSKAPVGHQHHVMDKRGMSRASSRAPLAFSKHNFDADITHAPSPALMTSRKLAAARMPRSATPSTSFVSESTVISSFKSTPFDMDPRSSPLPQQIASPRKEKNQSDQFLDIPTLRLDDTSSFVPYSDNRKSSNLTFLGEERTITLSPSNILVSQEISRGDSPLPQQILTPRNDEDIKKEHVRKKRQHAKKASSNNKEPSNFTDKRSGSTLYNDTIASKMKKRGKDFVDTGNKGLEVPPPKRSRTPSPSFHDASATDLENDLSDVEV